MIERLNVFLGEWEMEVSVEGVPLVRIKTNFEWFEDRAFLIQHSVNEPPLPTTPQIWIDNNPNPITALIGLDDFSQEFYYVYADARSVRRVYQMSIEDGIWKIWGRAGEKFFQRFESIYNNDKKTIIGKWESSKDGKNWELDFDVKYEYIKNE
jgi:hypothetical protein